MNEIRWKPLPMARRPTTAGGLPRALLDTEGRRRRRAIVRATLALALVALPACGVLAARARAAGKRPPAAAPAADRRHESRGEPGAGSASPGERRPGAGSSK